MSRRFLRLVCCIASLLTLASCSFLRNDSAPEEVLQKGGTLTIGLAGLGTGPLDPARATGAMLDLISFACDGLVGRDKETSQPRPALAESWNLNDSATKLTLKLRKTSKFSDQTPVDAQSVVESMNRLVRAETGSPWSGLMADVEGFDAVKDAAASTLSGLRSLDSHTIEIVLSRPFSDLPVLLSHPALIPVSPKHDVGDEALSCAGPFSIDPGAGERDFTLRRYKSGTRSEAYSGGGTGFVSVIKVRGFDADADAYAAFKNQEVDIASVPQNLVSEAAGTRGYARGAAPELTYLAAEFTKSPTDNLAMRRAISLAIDRLTIIDAAYGDQRLPALRWVSGIEDEAAPSRCEEYSRKISDPERAKQLMAESGLDPSTVKLPLFFDQADIGLLVAQAIQVQVEHVLGVKIEPRPVDAAGLEASLQQRSEAGLWLVRSNPQLQIPSVILGSMFTAGGTENRFGFQDPDVEAAVSAARRSVGFEDRSRDVMRAEDLICDKMPHIPLWQSVRHWVYRGGIDFEGPAVDSQGSLIVRHAVPT